MFKRQRSICMIFGLVITALLAISGTVGARQADTEIWYWAYNDSQIIAYTPEGKTQVVYEAAGAFAGEQLWGRRLESDQFILSNRSNVMQLLIGPDEVLDIANSETVSYFFPVDYQRPYLIGVSGGPTFVPFKIMNIETGRIYDLNGYLLDLYYEPSVGHPVFLSDGDTIRYFSVAERGEFENNVGNLWELNLATGEEKTLATIPFVPDSYFASPDSSQWWFFQNTDSNFAYENLVTFGPVNQEVTELLAAGIRGLWREYVVVYEEHSILLYPIEGGEPFSYIMPQYIRYLDHLYPDQSLLVMDDWYEVWLLDATGSTKSLGVFSPVMIDVSAYQEVGGEYPSSTDGRWLVTLNSREEQQHYQLWDMERREVVLEQPVDGRLTTRFTNDAVLIRDLIIGQETLEKAAVYLVNENRTVILPDIETGHWLDVMTDSKLLYEEYGPSSDLAPGLYAYDIFSETFTLLLADVKPVILRYIFE